jgi:hypothetical protein
MREHVSSVPARTVASAIAMSILALLFVQPGMAVASEGRPGLWMLAAALLAGLAAARGALPSVRPLHIRPLRRR